MVEVRGTRYEIDSKLYLIFTRFRRFILRSTSPIFRDQKEHYSRSHLRSYREEHISFSISLKNPSQYSVDEK